MSSEALYVPEENLADVIAVIRAGLKVARVDIGTQLSLEEWCAEEEAYLKAMDDDFEDDDDG